MSTRERWIVYPLLFMTLGIAMRDKVVPPAQLGNFRLQFEAGEISCDRLQCHTLLVNGPNGQPVVAAGADATSRAGTVETFAANGMPLVRLFSNAAGGVVATLGRAGRLGLTLGDTGQNFGLFAELPELGQVIPLTLPLRFGGKPSVPQPPKEPTAPEKPAGRQTPDKATPPKTEGPKR
jgi:hypothetical protein